MIDDNRFGGYAPTVVTPELSKAINRVIPLPGRPPDLSVEED